MIQDATDPEPQSVLVVDDVPDNIELLSETLRSYRIRAAASGIRALPTPILENLPRPDSVPVNTQQLFSSAPMTSDQEGLYVFVRDGHIEVTTASETLHLGKGETGFASDAGRTVRPLLMPLFLEFDRTPKPDSANPMLQTVLNETVNRPANQCR